MLHRRHALIALLSPVLTGCSRLFEIQVSWPQGATPRLRFARPGAAAGDTRVEALNGLAVYLLADSAASADYREPLWSIALPPGQGSELAELMYGQCPAGFRELRAAAPLRPGGHGLVVAIGPGAQGEGRFQVPAPSDQQGA